MTFLEAAIEVLRHESKALHFSDIAKVAVDRKLLSHVGRDPEAAMRSCLTSAVRGGHSDVISRTKPGHYMIRPGAVLPDPPPETAVDSAANGNEAKKTNEIKSQDDKSQAASKPRRRSTAEAKVVSNDGGQEGEETSMAADTDTDEGGTSPEGARRGRRRRRGRKGDRSDKDKNDAAAESDAASDESDRDDDETDVPAANSKGQLGDQVRLEFSAPEGAGLEGVTDVAVVMANAMSRLAHERPELREELEAMQAKQEKEAAAATTSRSFERPASHSNRPPAPRAIVTTRPARRERDDVDERLSRRRRRRRRRSRRVDWAQRNAGDVPGGRIDDLLDRVGKVLQEAGNRSLHIRQISEALAEQQVLGGEISEIERAVTSAILADARRLGRRSRFVARGDARYQLQASRLPKAAAEAEESLRGAALAVESQTKLQLVNWLGSLGVRALESVVRIYLQRRDYPVVASLAPTRGLAKLIVEDLDEDDGGKNLVVVVPRKSTVESGLWQSDAEENGCSQVLIFAMGDAPDDPDGPVRIVGAQELGRWLFDNGVGVERMSFEVPVLDPVVIESIGGLDT